MGQAQSGLLEIFVRSTPSLGNKQRNQIYTVIQRERSLCVIKIEGEGREMES